MLLVALMVSGEVTRRNVDRNNGRRVFFYFMKAYGVAKKYFVILVSINSALTGAPANMS